MDQEDHKREFMYNETEEERLLSKNYRAKLIENIVGTENKKRKLESVRSNEIYKNKLAKHVKSKLLSYVSTDKLKQMSMIDFMGFCKKIINDEASIYVDAPNREFHGVSEANNDALANIYKDMNYDDRAKKHNRIFKLQNQSPSYIVPKNGKLIKRPLLNHQYDIIENPEDCEDHVGYILSNLNQPKDKSDQRFVVWSKRFNFTMNGDAEITTDEIDMLNPISPTIPFSMAQQDSDGDVYIDDETTEVNFTVSLNAAITELYHIMRMQGFSQPVITLPSDMKTPMLLPTASGNLNDGESFANSINEGNEKALDIGTNDPLILFQDENGRGANFSYVSPSPDLTGSIEVLSVILSGYLTSKGIDPKKINLSGESGKSFSSGWERFLSLVDDFKATQDDFTVFREVESSDFLIIRAYHNAYSNDEDVLDKKYRSTTIPQESYVNTTFHEPKDILTETETINTNSVSENAGYQSRIMSIKNIHGFKTNEEAVEHIKQMKKDKETLIQIEGVTDDKTDSRNNKAGGLPGTPSSDPDKDKEQ